MSLFKKRKTRLPQQVQQQLGLGSRERVLAFAIDDNSGRYVVATTWRLIAASAESIALDRSWSDVDAGNWQPDTWTLTVTWVDRSRAAQWTFAGQETSLPEVLHERVQATVVLASPLGLSGPRSSGRVVIRKELRTQELSVQTVLGRQTSADDPQVAEAIAVVSAELRDRVGL